MSDVNPKSKGIKKARGSKKKKDPNAPKRPRTAYIMFCSVERANAKKANPNAKPSEILKILAEMWKNLPESQKKEFNEKAKDDKDRYKDAMQSYNPPENMDDDEPPAKSKKGRAKKAKDPKAPKRTQTAYILFGKDARIKIKSEHPDISQSEIMKMIGAQWNAMTEDEKKPYQEKANADKARFESEKATYEQNKDDEPMDDDQGDDDAGGDDEPEEQDDDDGGDDDDDDEDDEAMDD